MSDTDLLITIRRGTDPDCAPLLITADPRVVGAVVDALMHVLRGPERPGLLRLVDRIGSDHAAPEPTP